MRYCKSTIFQANHNACGKCVACLNVVCDTAKVRFFKQITTSSSLDLNKIGCLRYCKSTIFQANHNSTQQTLSEHWVVCDTAKVRFFKQITTKIVLVYQIVQLFAILQKYDFSSKSQPDNLSCSRNCVVCDTAKVRFFKQITTTLRLSISVWWLFAILQKYDFSSKSQLYCHTMHVTSVVCDTAKVRFFKQITTKSK